MVNVDIRAQVTKYLLRQNCAEGLLPDTARRVFCQIRTTAIRDRSPAVSGCQRSGPGTTRRGKGQLAQSEAQLVQDQAQLLSAEASQSRTQLDVDKYAPLNQERAIRQRDMDNATQNNPGAKAQVEAAKARVETAKAALEAAQVIQHP